VIVFLYRINALGPVENVATTVFRPVQTFFSQGAQQIKNISVYFSSVQRLKRENDEFKNTIANLMVENGDLKQKIEDSKLIEEQLNFVTEHNYNSVIGKVVGRNSDQTLKAVVINKGNRDGIKIGYPVMVNSGILIGKIIDVNENTSIVMLLNDNRSQFSAITQNEAKTPGIVKGQFGIALQMELIPQNQPLDIGQTIITSGLEDFIPSNLIIGIIKEKTSITGELFQQAIVEPPVDYEKISIITVILPYND
jgi:rod shape-determining protein MreC